MDYPRQFLWMCWMATQEGGRWEDDGTSVARAESDGKGKEKDGRKAGQPPPPKLARCDAKDVNEKGRCVEKGIQVYSMTPRPPLSNPDGIADWGGGETTRNTRKTMDGIKDVPMGNQTYLCRVAPEYRIRRDEKGRIAMVVEGVGRGVGRGR